MELESSVGFGVNLGVTAGFALSNKEKAKGLIGGEVGAWVGGSFVAAGLDAYVHYTGGEGTTSATTFGFNPNITVFLPISIVVPTLSVGPLFEGRSLHTEMDQASPPFRFNNVGGKIDLGLSTVSGKFAYTKVFGLGVSVLYNQDKSVTGIVTISFHPVGVVAGMVYWCNGIAGH